MASGTESGVPELFSLGTPNDQQERELLAAEQHADNALRIAVCGALLVPVLLAGFGLMPFALWQSHRAESTYRRYPDRAYEHAQQRAKAARVIAWVVLVPFVLAVSATAGMGMLALWGAFSAAGT